jgi:TonB family protein
MKTKTAVLAALILCAKVAQLQATEGKVLTVIDPKSPISDPYSVPWPRNPQGRFYEGTTTVLAHLDESGNVIGTKVESTSGIHYLDVAATQGIKRWHFAPKIDNGVAVKSYISVPVTMQPVSKF